MGLVVREFLFKLGKDRAFVIRNANLIDRLRDVCTAGLGPLAGLGLGHRLDLELDGRIAPKIRKGGKQIALSLVGILTLKSLK